jgi:hypothetical protein
MVAGPSCRSGLMTALGTEAPNGRVGGTAGGLSPIRLSMVSHPDAMP